MAMTKREQLLRIKDEYRATHGFEAASSRAMAEWAVKEDKYKLPEFATVAKCAEELAEAMRTEYMEDERGHRVRVMHSAPSAQGRLWDWDHIETASREFMEASAAQRRSGIVFDVKQLKIDLDYFNGLHSEDEPLQISFNFTNDLADLGLLGSSSTEPAPRASQSPPVAPPSTSRRAPSRLSSRPGARERLLPDSSSLTPKGPSPRA